jgi:hypothetical protein
MIMNNEDLPALPLADKSKANKAEKEKKNDQLKSIEEKKLRPAEL